MGAAVAALGGVSERQYKAFIASRKRLQTQVTLCRKAQGLSGEIAHGSLQRRARCLDQSFRIEEIGHPWRAAFVRLHVGFSRSRRRLAVGGEHEVEKTVRIIEG